MVERVLQDLCEVEVDIAAVGRLEHDLRSRGARVLGVDYTGEALLRFAIPPLARSVAEDIVKDLTSGTARLRVIGQRWVTPNAEAARACYSVFSTSGRMSSMILASCLESQPWHGGNQFPAGVLVAQAQIAIFWPADW